MKPVTIQDIATHSGVSKATVSRVLNGTTAVNEDKRVAVLAAIDELGFKPNALAQSLAKGRSMTVGVLTQNIGAPFYDAVAQGVIAALGETAYSPIFVDGQWRREVEKEAIKALIGRRVDGLILIGGDVGDDDLDALGEGLPAIVVGRDLGRGRHCISVDNVDGGYRATKHLIDLGHRRIAFIGGIEHHPDAIDRFEGYRRALDSHGVASDPDLVLPGDFSAQSGVRAIETLCGRGTPFTAVFAANDTTAFGARLALYRRDVQVPGEVSLVGFDDQAESAFMAPPLTTVRQPAREMGEHAARGLLGLIGGEPFRRQVLKAELQVRESTAGRRPIGALVG